MVNLKKMYAYSFLLFLLYLLLVYYLSASQSIAFSAYTTFSHEEFGKQLLSFVASLSGIIAFLFIPGFLVQVRKQFSLSIPIILKSFLYSIMILNVIFLTLKLFFTFPINRLVLVISYFLFFLVMFFFSTKNWSEELKWGPKIRKNYVLSSFIFVLFLFFLFYPKIVSEDVFDDSVEVIEITRSLEYEIVPNNFQPYFFSFSYFLSIADYTIGHSEATARIMGLVFLFLILLTIFDYLSSRQPNRKQLVSFSYAFFIFLLLAFYAHYEGYSDLTYPGFIDLIIALFLILTIYFYQKEMHFLFLFSAFVLSTVHVIGFIALFSFIAACIAQSGLIYFKTKKFSPAKIKMLLLVITLLCFYFVFFSFISKQYLFAYGSVFMQTSISSMASASQFMRNVILFLFVTLCIPVIYLIVGDSTYQSKKSFIIFLTVVIYGLLVVITNRNHIHYYVVIFPLVAILLLDLLGSFSFKNVTVVLFTIVLIVLLLIPYNYTLYRNFSLVGDEICIENDEIQISHTMFYKMHFPPQYNLLPLDFYYYANYGNCSINDYSIILTDKNLSNRGDVQRYGSTYIYYLRPIQLSAKNYTDGMSPLGSFLYNFVEYSYK